ncbi:acyltransferase family protein [Cephaloticoccus primus]|uniref:acyltransferase family protein n=1 Tax=Cephaloticoccus primus TaxID=1548207 RepID=UPI0009ED30C7|nr:acyltransferase [Cephaloticoccus primus]
MDSSRTELPVLPKEKTRFSEVDSLRAIACALVIIFHSAAVFGGSHRVELFSGAGRGGGVLGVLVFFIISGYVIPSSLRGARFVGFKRFAIRRFWRLWPPFWVSLFALYFCNASKYSGEQLAFGMTMFPGLFGISSVGSYFWTLEVELFFYVIVAVAFLIFGRLSTKLTVALFTTSLAWCWAWPNLPGAGGYWIRLSVFLALMFFGASCRTFVQKKGYWSLGRVQVSIRAILIGVATGLVSIWPVQGAYFSFLSGELYHVKAAVVILAAILGFLFWVVLTPVRISWLARVGRWTYSTYLFHGVALYLLPGRFVGWSLPAYVAGALVLSFSLGGLLYRWIEQPSDRIGKRLSGES